MRPHQSFAAEPGEMLFNEAAGGQNESMLMLKEDR